MTPGSADFSGDSAVPPILVLGLGNLLLGDDGTGLSLLELVQQDQWPETVELVDGGTQGLALLGVVADRKLVLILDAVGLGDEAGTVHVLRDDEVLNVSPPRATSAHEGNAGELLQAAALVGDLPERMVVVGVEPFELKTRIGLSSTVEAALPRAAATAREVIEQSLILLGS